MRRFSFFAPHTFGSLLNIKEEYDEKGTNLYDAIQVHS